jgi:hypothetical protein
LNNKGTCLYRKVEQNVSQGKDKYLLSIPVADIIKKPNIPYKKKWITSIRLAFLAYRRRIMRHMNCYHKHEMKYGAVVGSSFKWMDVR